MNFSPTFSFTKSFKAFSTSAGVTKPITLENYGCQYHSKSIERTLSKELVSSLANLD